MHKYVNWTDIGHMGFYGFARRRPIRQICDKAVMVLAWQCSDHFLQGFWSTCQEGD